MPALKFRAAALLACSLWAAAFDPVHAAEDWQDVVFTSSTVGNHTNRLCMGVPDYKRTSDIGCPSYAPSLSTAGHVSVSGNVSANKFIGDGSGLTNLTVQGDRITSDTHAAIINQNTGYVSLTTSGGTWGYFSASWSYLANLFTHTVSSSLVSATNVSATYVDATRNGTVSGTYGYFRYISGTDISGRFTGDGSGLSGVIAGSSDRIVSGSTGGTRMVAISESGYISITQAGANSGWFDPYRGLVTLGVSATGGISGTSGYFSGGVGIGTAAPATNLEVSGSLRLSGLGTDTFITPLSIPLQTKINIPLFDPPAFGQIMVTGLDSTAPASARAFTFVDARTVAHQPTVGVLSPNESDLFGLSWDGLNTAAFIKSLGANIIIRANTTDIANFLASGEVGIGKSDPKAKLDVAGTISASDAIQVGASGLACGVGIPGAIRYNSGNLQYCNGASWVTLSGGGIADWYSISNIPAQVAAVSDGTVISMQTVSATALNAHFVSGTQGHFPAATIVELSAGGIAANSVSSTRVSATNVSATFVDATRNGTVSATYGYFRFISGTDIFGRFTGDGSGLTGVTAAASDRIISGTNGATRMVAISETGYISMTQAGANSAWFDPYRGLVTLGVSTTGAISGTRGYFSGPVGVGLTNPAFALDVSGSVNIPGEQLLRLGHAYHYIQRSGTSNHYYSSAFHRMTGPTGDVAVFVTTNRTSGFYGGVAIGSGYVGHASLPVSGAIIQGNVGIGTPAPSTTLHVSGTVRLSDSGEACDANRTGAIRYTSQSIFQVCKGSVWLALLDAGSGGVSGDRIVSGTTNITAWQDGSLTFTTAGADRMVIDGAGNMSFGVSYTAGTQRYYFYDEQQNKAAYRSFHVNPTFRSSTNGTYYNTGLLVSPAMEVASGVSNPGYVYGQWISAFRRDAADAGSLDALVGLVINTGHYQAVASARNTSVTTGLLIGMYAQNGNIPTMYGLRIVSRSGVYVTNSYGISQEGAHDRNYFAGNTGIGQGKANPLAKLDVAGTISASDAIQLGQNTIACGVQVSGSIRYNTTSDTVQFCNGTSWTSLASGTTGGGTLSGTGSATAVAFWSGDNALTYSDGFYWDNINKRLGIGKNNPSYALDVSVSGLSGIIISNTSSGVTNASNLYLSRGDAANGYAGVVFATRGVDDWTLNVPAGGNDLRIWNNGAIAELVRFTTSGKVGIGTSSPSATLTVSGTISATNAIQVGTSTLTCGTPIAGALRYNSPNLQLCNGSTWTSIGGGGGGTVTGTGSATAVAFWSGASGLTYSDGFYWDNSNRRLGIGTNQPNAALVVSSTTSNLARFITNGDGINAVIEIQDASPGQQRLAAINFLNGAGLSKGQVAYASGYNYMVFRTNSAERVRIVSTGEVGIGTQSPTATLQVSGTFIVSSSGQNVSPSLFVGTDARVGIGTPDPQGRLHIHTPDSTMGLILSRDGDNVTAIALSSSLGLTGFSGGGSGGFMRVHTAGGVRMTIDSSGRVGISTSVPKAKLDVAGTISASDAIQLGQNTIACGVQVSGSIRYNTVSDTVQFCNGAGWVSLASGTTGDSTAMGDRITSGTLAMVANSATSYVSLSTNGTTWGYLNSANSYLPALSAGRVNSTNISGSIIQVGNTGASCTSGISGSIRYSSVSSTMEYCNSTAWVSMGPSDTVPVSFRVHKNGSNQTVSAGVVTLLTWSTEEFDGNNNFSGNRFTPTVPGRYIFNAGVFCQSTTGCGAYIYKNGNVVGESLVGPSGSGSGITQAIAIVHMNGTTDYVEAYGYNRGGTVIDGNAGVTNFSGALIGPQGSGGGGGSDNLGDHTATQDLVMGAHNIVGTGQVSVTNVSATYLQLSSPSTVLACNSGLAGSMRYTSGTMQVCDGNNWGNIGIGVPAGTIAAFNASSCPAGWTEYTPARGRFLRGLNGSGVDPDGNRAPGNQQADAMQQITGSFQYRGNSNITYTGAFGSGSNGSSENLFASASSGARVTTSFDSANSPGARTATETRPSNVAVIFCSYSGFQSAPGQTILTTLASLTDVSVAGATNGQVLTYSGGTWIASNTANGGSGVSAMASLTDVTLTNLAGRDYLRYDSVAGKWVNISESAVMSTTTMVAGFPDSIRCLGSDSVTRILYLEAAPSSGNSFVYRSRDSSFTTNYSVNFNANGTYSSNTNLTGASCINKTIAQLYEDGQAFNFIGNAASGDSTALGDRITSGTLAVVANSATTYVSFSTAGTTWGYLNSANSYLPTLSSTRVSATAISTTIVELASRSVGSLAGSGANFIASGTTSVSVSSAGYVTMGINNGNRPISFRPGFGDISTKADTGGWTWRYGAIGSGGTDQGGFGFYGSADALSWYYIGPSYSSPFVAVTSGGYVGLGGITAPGYRLELPNTASVAGRGRANQWATYSDGRFKTDRKPIDNALEKVMQLNGITYRSSLSDSAGLEIGYIAQAVEQVVPEVVSIASTTITLPDGTTKVIPDYRSMDYARLVPVLSEAIKELKAANDNNDQMLRAEIDDLRRELRELKQAKQ